MSDQKNESSTSFVNAFLPGLILGLIVGAVAGAYLPDMMNKPAIQVPDEIGHSSGPRDVRDAVEETADDAAGAVEDAADDVENAVEDAADDAEDLIDGEG